MKKFVTICVLTLVAVFCCIACTITSDSQTLQPTSDSIESDLVSQESQIPHEHDLILLAEKSPTCSEKGRIECYYCWICKGFFADEEALTMLTEEQLTIAEINHEVEKNDRVEPSCAEKGTIEHWVCINCGGKFADEECVVKLSLSQIEIQSTPHYMNFSEGYPVNGEQNGMKEHWKCINCDGYFADEEGTISISQEDLVIRSFINIPDFLVEIPEGKDPVVLQLSDTQIIDGAQSRPNKSSGDRITYATEKIQQYCYDYLEEIINATNPDLIILTGDLVYGEYDDNGTVWLSLISFMESFQIPWAPVLGNHDAESKMGVDWQCEQLENAEYCLFKQRDLMGNGNYSVGILQGGKITRMFFMLDSNGNSNASQESLSNGHTSKSVGFFESQIEWYTNEIEQMKELSPNTKYSFVYHIQQAVFGEAFAKYGFDQNKKEQGINIDTLANKGEDDFGYIGRKMKDPWDSSKNVYEGMKALGVDSIFVGHEHCNSASVMYEGIRFQYGQKSSEYDRHNAVNSSGNIVENAIYAPQGTPIIGGSVIVLSANDGTIVNAYIYYCKNAN